MTSASQSSSVAFVSSVFLLAFIKAFLVALLGGPFGGLRGRADESLFHFVVVHVEEFLVLHRGMKAEYLV